MNISIHKIAAVHHALRVGHPREVATIINASRQGAALGKSGSEQSQAHFGLDAAHRRLVSVRAQNVRQYGYSRI